MKFLFKLFLFVLLIVSDVSTPRPLSIGGLESSHYEEVAWPN